MTDQRYIDKLVSFDTAPGGDLVIKHSQEIPDEFLTELRQERGDSLTTPAGTFHRVASVPIACVEWMEKQGIDLNRAPISEILRWMRKWELDAFITSNKV
jgi:hypothetical protein